MWMDYDTSHLLMYLWGIFIDFNRYFMFEYWWLPNFDSLWRLLISPVLLLAYPYACLRILSGDAITFEKMSLNEIGMMIKNVRLGDALFYIAINETRYQ